ncbi:MAG TPA: DNA repair protein RecO [Desulfatiglandales bacterium]|nr:DNA repair protein RecO [Desulfatiglandales bacterium]
MEPKKSEGIILRTRDFGESDRLITVFSSLCGTLKGVAKGARRSSRRFVNSLNIFSLVDLQFSERRSSELVWLDSCELIDGYPGIRSDYNLLPKASFMVEMTEILFPLNVQCVEMFQLLKFALSSISDKKSIEETLTFFQIQAMKIGGFGINVSKCGFCGRAYTGKGRALFHPPSGSIVCMACEKVSALIPGLNPETVDILGKLQSSDLPLNDALECEKEILSELKQVMKAHINYRLGSRLKAAKYL